MFAFWMFSPRLLRVLARGAASCCSGNFDKAEKSYWHPLAVCGRKSGMPDFGNVVWRPTTI
jgi:hypothetical protein